MWIMLIFIMLKYPVAVSILSGEVLKHEKIKLLSMLKEGHIYASVGCYRTNKFKVSYITNDENNI